ncbi:HAD family hydrolase [Paenibacillus sp. PAMC21692]|uniref:HAD family hydrolase n=1 Tax=Paenibacillus sp. PAMC21692 TaxID=2762320 RepID=UPI00164CFAF0|nr:HAD family hydrolase [Paenibacillus sp. PAMC21692]QNK55697.1 HAD family hydrolase [Paenibacillus sp. PAMC21692]
MESIKAILFDLDNTLLDRTATFDVFTRAFLKNYFAHLDAVDELHKRIVELDQDGYKDKTKLFEELMFELPWKQRPDAGELMDFYRAEYVKSAAPMNHAGEIIAHVRSRYKTGLITNGRNEIQYGKIDRLGIRHDFDVILVSEEAGVKKPEPSIFAMALNKLDLRPEQCLFIGDHPVNDIEAPHKLGMKTIWVKANQPWRDGLTAQPIATVERLSELLDII